MSVPDHAPSARWRHGLLLLWWLITLIGIPAFLLPTPGAVASALWHGRLLLAHHGLITALEMMGGLLIGVLTGGLLALGMVYFPRLQRWLMPVVLTSQAIPVFALVRAGAAAGAVVRLRHERQSGDGGAYYLFPGRVVLF